MRIKDKKTLAKKKYITKNAVMTKILVKSAINQSISLS
jgi:hypothetical protein